MRERVAAILGAIRTAAASVTDAPGCDVSTAPRLVLVSPLAAGADQVVARAAVEQGYELRCVFPFPEEDYVRDFAGDPQGAAEFAALRARSTATLELDGARTPVGAAAAAYEAVGRVVMDQSDILLAVWDGKPPEGRGGTGQVVPEALAAGMPVVVVPPGSPADARLMVCDRGAPACESSLDALPSRVRRLLVPLDAEPSSADAAAGSADTDDLGSERVQRYADFLAERHPAALPLRRRVPARLLSRAWKRFMRAFGAGDWARPERAAIPDRTGSVETYRRSVGEHAEWVGELAARYAGLFRGAFLVNYVLGTLAVLMALAGLLPSLARAAGALAVAEALCVGAILVIVVAERRRRWHERWIDYRILSEFLREMEYLAPLGLAVPFTRPRAHLGERADLNVSWMVAHFRALLRDAGMVDARWTPEYLAACRRMVGDEWLGGQEAYHRSTAVAHDRAGRFCGVVAGGAFAGAFLACFLHFVLPKPFHGALAALAAGLPAVGAAFHGIRSQGEFERVAERSRAMALHLAEARARLGDGSGALASRHLREEASAAAAQMIDELNDWQVLSRAGEVPAP